MPYQPPTATQPVADLGTPCINGSGSTPIFRLSSQLVWYAGWHTSPQWPIGGENPSGSMLDPYMQV